MEDEKPKTWADTQQVVAFTLIGATIVIILIWMIRPPTGSEGAMAMLNGLLGSLVTAFVMVVSYYFGSSKGSKDKDATIAANAAEKAAPAAAAQAAPPAADVAAPPAAEIAVDKALRKRDEHSK